MVMLGIRIEGDEFEQVAGEGEAAEGEAGQGAVLGGALAGALAEALEVGLSATALADPSLAPRGE